MNNTLIDFTEHGYAVFPEAVTKIQVANLRHAYELYLAKKDISTILPTDFLQMNMFMSALLSDKTVAGIKTLLGNTFCIFPNFTVRESVYLPWHNDAYFLSDEVKSKSAPLHFIQCAIYLQDNDDVEGGGVTVVPGSHKNILRKSKNYDSENIDSCAKNVINRAGDLVVWDNRITHRSSTPVINPTEKKLAIQWTSAVSKEHSDEYLAYLKKRASQKLHVSDYVGRRPISYFSDMPNVKFPDTFPKQIRIRMEEMQVSFIGF